MQTTDGKSGWLTSPMLSSELARSQGLFCSGSSRCALIGWTSDAPLALTEVILSRGAAKRNRHRPVGRFGQ